MIMNGKPFNPGDLRIPITLESRASIAVAGGFLKPGWTEFKQVKAKWVNAHGSEAWTAALAQAEEPATVTIRFVSGLDETFSVVKGSKRFEIVSIDDIQERHELLELKVKRMGAG